MPAFERARSTSSVKVEAIASPSEPASGSVSSADQLAAVRGACSDPNRPVRRRTGDEERARKAGCAHRPAAVACERRVLRDAPLEALAPEKLEPIGTRVIRAEVAEAEVHLDRAQQAIMIVALLLESRLDAVAEEDGVDLIGTVIGGG